MSVLLQSGSHTSSEAVQARTPKHILNLKPYIPGKPISAVAHEFGLNENQIIKLASNENPLGMSPLVRAALKKAVLEETGQYPDPNATELKDSICDRYGVTPECILIGCGSSEVLDIAARTFVEKGESIVFSQYSFASYSLVTQAVGAQGISAPASNFGHDLEAMLEGIKKDTKLIFIANPNNPTGTFLPGAELYGFLKQVPEDVVVVLDEAYTEYLAEEDRYDSLAWTEEFANLIVLRTFSKAYGLASLRIGFAIAQKHLIDLMNRVRPVFNVGNLAQIAATVALKDIEFIQQVVALNHRGRKQLYEGLKSLGLPYLESWANFVLVEVGEAARINEDLLRRGVIVRPVGNYGLPTWLRVSTGTPDQNRVFLETLAEVL